MAQKSKALCGVPMATPNQVPPLLEFREARPGAFPALEDRENLEGSRP